MTSCNPFSLSHRSGWNRHPGFTQRKRKLVDVSGYVCDERYQEYYDAEQEQEDPLMITSSIKWGFNTRKVCFHPGIKKRKNRIRRRAVRRKHPSKGTINWDSEHIFLE